LVRASAPMLDRAQTREKNMRKFSSAGAFALAVLWANPSLANADPLSLSEAIRLAVTAEDPQLLSLVEKTAALEDQAIADAQLEDPTISGGIANLSTDTFRFSQENMTQAQVGIRQVFPAGRTLSLRGGRRQAEAGVMRARKELALREISLAVRTAWFDGFYWTSAQKSVLASKRAVNEMIQALHASFSTGVLTTQHILRAELELSLLDDQLTDFLRREELARAELERFLGVDALRPLSSNLPDLSDPPSIAEMEEALVQHPAVLIADAVIEVGDADVGLAEQAYKPSWALEGKYGARGGSRSDLASIGVTLSIPLFAADRQDRRLSAAVRQRGAAQLDRSATLLDLRRDLERATTDWSLLGERVQLYSDAVIERARETANASISTYASGRTDFPELIRSQLAQLDAELKRMELRTERGKAWAKLNYLVGEVQ